MLKHVLRPCAVLLAGVLWIALSGCLEAAAPARRPAQETCVIEPGRSIQKNLLEPLPDEEQIEQLRDLCLVAAARFMFEADEKLLTSHLGVSGVARRGYNAETALLPYGPGRRILLAPEELLVLVPGVVPGDKHPASGLQTSKETTLSVSAFTALVRQLDEVYVARGAAPADVQIVAYTATPKLLKLEYLGAVSGPQLYADGLHGFVRSTVTSQEELHTFLGKIDELIEARMPAKDIVDLAGRRLPGAKQLGITAEDWRVIARIYAAGAKVPGFAFRRPGFSLDPFLNLEKLKSADRFKPGKGADKDVRNLISAHLDSLTAAIAKIEAEVDGRQFIPVDPYLAPLLHLEDRVQRDADNPANLEATRNAMAEFGAWLRELSQQSTVSCARYDGGVASLNDKDLKEGLRYSEIGRTFFYVDYLAKFATSHEFDLHKRVPGLLTLPKVRTRFPAWQHEMLMQKTEGRLWLEPSKTGHVVEPTGVRFSPRVVRLLGARNEGGRLSHKEVALPADFEETFARFERYYDECAAVEPQLARFRELMKLLLLFEAAHQSQPRVSLVLPGIKFDAAPDPKITVTTGWLRENTTQQLHQVMMFLRRTDGGTETLDFNPTEQISYFCVGREFTYRGVSGPQPDHIKNRIVPGDHSERLKNLAAPLEAEIRSLTRDRIVIPDRELTIKLNNNQASVTRDPRARQKAFTGNGTEVTQDKELFRAARQTADGLELSERSAAGPEQSLTFSHVTGSTIKLELSDGLAHRSGVNLRDYWKSVRYGEHPSCVLENTGKSVVVAVVRSEGDGLKSPPAIASHGSTVRTKWVEARELTDPVQIAAVKRLPSTFQLTATSWNALTETPVIVRSNQGMLEIGDLPANAYLRQSAAQLAATAAGRKVISFDASSLSDKEVVQLLGLRGALAKKLNAVINIQLTKGEDATWSRVMRYSRVPQLDLLADLNSIEKAGGLGPRVAEYLAGAGSIRATPGQGKLRCLFAEALNAKTTVEDWIALAKGGEFNGDVVLVGICPEAPEKLVRLARVAREHGAIEVILPDSSLDFTCFPLVTNKLRQMYSTLGEPELLIGLSHEDALREAHLQLISDIKTLQKTPLGDRAAKATELMKVDGDTVDASKTLDLSDGGLQVLLDKLQGDPNEPAQRTEGMKLGPFSHRDGEVNVSRS